jgi:hypothetical protein
MCRVGVGGVGSFEWNSVVAEAGITLEDRRFQQCDDGELARALQEQPRFEDPVRQAVVWPRSAQPPPAQRTQEMQQVRACGAGTSARSDRSYAIAAQAASASAILAVPGWVGAARSCGCSCA